MTTRPTSKRGESYWELIQLIYPMVKRGESTKKMVRAAKAQGLKKRDGTNLDVAYISATIYNKKLKTAPSLEHVIGTWPPKKRTKKPKAEPVQKTDMYNIVLASDMPSAKQLERIREINAGEWSSPERTLVDRDGHGNIVVAGQSLTQGDIELIPLTPAQARIFIAAVPQIEALL